MHNSLLGLLRKEAIFLEKPFLKEEEGEEVESLVRRRRKLEIKIDKVMDIVIFTRKIVKIVALRFYKNVYKKIYNI